jgi:membrane protease YdiL (CAAX protease family)
LIQPLFLMLFVPDRVPDAAPGSDRWHRLQSADAAAKLAIAGAIVWVIVRTSRSSPRPSPGRFSRLALVSCATFPALLTICLAQNGFATAVWDWFEPHHRAPQHDLLTAFTRSEWGGWGRIQLMLIAVVVAPLAEELFFRGLLLPALWRLMGFLWPAVGLSAAFFALVHAANPQTVLPMFTFGVVMAGLRAQTGSLAACVLLHALFNGRTMLLAVYHPEILSVCGS